MVTLPETAGALADLAQAALEAALAIARAEVGPDADRTRLAVIAMGKTGGCELNYISDVDVIFVAEPADGVPEEESTAIATDLATRLMRICSASTAGRVAVAGRPRAAPRGQERAAGAHRRQPPQLLRALGEDLGVPGAAQGARRRGRPALWGRRTATRCSRWCGRPSSRENFVDDVQAMRRRVEQHIPAAEADRQLKLGPGGLRDVEFTVQLLQLVHGRADESLRTGTTLDGAGCAVRRGLRGARRRRDPGHGIPAAAHPRAPHPAVPAAAHAPDADVRERPALAGSGSGTPLLARGGRGRAVARTAA